MPELSTRTFPTPLEEALRRAEAIAVRRALWPSVEDVEAAESAVRAQLVTDFLAASATFDQVAIDGALAVARTYDLANPERPPVLDELTAIRWHEAAAA